MNKDGEALILEIFEWIQGGDASDEQIASVYEVLFGQKVTVVGDDLFRIDD